MADQLFIRLTDQHADADVVVLNDAGHVLKGPARVPLAAAADWTEGRQTTVLLPAEDVIGSVAALPQTSPARLRQMLPFSLEDAFAGDIDELHFAAGARNDDNAVSVSVIARERLDHWLAVLGAAGIIAHRLCSEADGAPDTPNTLSLFLDGSRVLGRRHLGAPFAFDRVSLAELMHVLEAEREDASDLAHVVLFVDPDAAAARGPEIDAFQASADDVNVRQLSDGCLPRLAAGLVARSAPNLLQGSYGRRTNLQALARPWRVAAGFVLAFLAFSVLAKGAELYKLGRDQTALTDQANAICAQSYGAIPLGSCLNEMGRRLTGAGQSTGLAPAGFLTSMTAVADAIDDAMVITNIGYRDRITTLELTMPNATYLDAFEQRLTGNGRFAMEPQNTSNERNGGIRTRIRILAVEP